MRLLPAVFAACGARASDSARREPPGGSDLTADPPACVDAGTALRDTDVPIELTPRTGTRRAPIEAIAVDGDYVKLRLAGTDGIDDRTVPLPKKAPLQVAVGDILDVQVQTVRVGGTAYDHAVELRDSGGVLWAAQYIGTMIPDAWGWSRAGTLPGEPGCTVDVIHAGVCVRVPSQSWRVLEAADGRWGVYATCPISAAPAGPQVIPDWTPSPMAIQISRLRP